METYEHRQAGTLVLWAMGGAATLTIAIFAIAIDEGPAVTAVVGSVLLVLAACAWIFGSLSVTVTDCEVACWFGPGMFRRRFAVTDIAVARTVRNPWYFGFGIKMIPKGWMYNVAGLDAVELELRNGRRFRIGTDEPQQLAAAIERARRRGTPAGRAGG
jgi:hypothetical protein